MSRLRSAQSNSSLGAWGPAQEPGVTRLVAAETIDPRHGSSSVWLQHELMSGFTQTIPMPGANGITTRDGWVAG